MFYRNQLNSCNKYMYLEYNKQEKEYYPLPKTLDIKEVKEKLIETFKFDRKNIDNTYIMDIFKTKIFCIEKECYYYINYSKKNFNDNIQLKMSYDKMILTYNNINIKKFYYINYNDKFVKNKEIDFNEFFKIVDVTDKVFCLNSLYLKNVLKNEEQAVLKEDCKKCSYLKYCLKSLDIKRSVFELTGNVNKLLRQEIYEYDRIDEKLLSKKQIIQYKNEEIINKEKIRQLLSLIKKPIYFIDFEKYNLAIPVYDGMKSNEGMIYQYSLHIYNKKLKHYEFISENIESTEKLAKKLNKLFKDRKNGSVVCYDDSMEKGVFKFLNKAFPNLKNLYIDSKDYIDISKIFCNNYVYFPKMKGKTSIKSVYNSITNGVSYEDLEEVNNGKDAALYYIKLLECKEKEKREELKKNMYKYCGLDTLAMYEIYLKLIELKD